VAFDATIDPGLSNRVEWIKFMALFFNAEPTANKAFASSMANINVEAVAAQRAVAGLPGKPTVAWVSYSQYDTPAYTLSVAAYKQQLVIDAGGQPVMLPNQTVDTKLNLTAWKKAVQGASLLIDETFWNPPQNYTYSTFLRIFNFSAADIASGTWPFLTNNRIYRADKTIADYNDGDYWGWDWRAALLPAGWAGATAVQAALMASPA